MTSLSARIAAYAALSAEERVDVELEAAAHPGLADDIADARAFADLLDAAAAASPTACLADDVADEAFGDPAAAARVGAARSSRPAQRSELDRMRAHAEELAASVPGIDLFEQLTGRVPALASSEMPSSQPFDRPPRAADRPAAPRPPGSAGRALSPLRRRMLVALVGLVVAYGGLRAASEATVPERARLADLGDLAAYEPLVTRGDTPPPLELRLDAALDGVAAARRSTLGLFPRYDADALDASAGELSVIVAEARPGSAVAEEARLALARVRLHQGRDAEAARLLAALVRDGGYRAPEARRLLDFLRTRAPEAPAEPN